MSYLVDQKDEIITKAKCEFVSAFKQGTWENFKYAEVCQNQKYFAIFLKWSDNIQFWKNLKMLIRIKMKQGIQSVTLYDQFTAVLIKNDLNIYYNKNKLITNTQNIKFMKQVTFNLQKQIIFKSCETVEIYDFVRKSLTVCDQCYISNNYEYCPINDIVLIPKGDKFTQLISVWSVRQLQIINKVHTDWLRELRIKMAKSGKQFIVSQFRGSGLNIYSYGDRIKHLRQIKSIEPYFQVEWVIGDKFLLIHSFLQFKVLQLDNDEISECKIKKVEKIQQNPTKYNQEPEIQRKQIHILIKISGQLAYYFSIVL
ncbi:hypothetical protein pb186bvf_002101 [Paramecium bursaria]